MNVKFDFSKLGKEGVDKIKALLQEYNVLPAAVVAPANTTPVVPVAPAPAKFGEGKLKDGTVVKWEGEGMIAQGFPVMVIDPANPTAFLPAPDGDLEFEDGTIVTVKDGKVESVKPAAAPPAPVMAPEMQAAMKKLETELQDVNQKFEAVKKEKETSEATLKKELDANKASLEKVQKDLTDTLEMFKKVMETPVADPVNIPAKPIIKSGIGSKVKS